MTFLVPRRRVTWRIVRSSIRNAPLKKRDSPYPIWSASTSVRKPSRPRLTPRMGMPRGAASRAPARNVPSPPRVTIRVVSLSGAMTALSGPSLSASHHLIFRLFKALTVASTADLSACDAWRMHTFRETADGWRAVDALTRGRGPGRFPDCRRRPAARRVQHLEPSTHCQRTRRGSHQAQRRWRPGP